MKALDVSHISKTYDTTTALHDVSFNVNENELFGLIGPDGAGKTSLIRIIITLLLADSGNVQLLGHDVVKDYKYLRRKIGYMPGRFSLYTDLTVLENLHFFATVFGTTIEENYDLIAPIYSQIEMFKNRKAGNLSGGMKQKLGLCCALIHKPEVLILDEPTTGVDAVSRKEFWEMLQELKQKGITILVSTPYMDEAEMCDRVALIQKGEIMSIATPKELIQQYPDKLIEIKSSDLYSVKEKLNKEFGNNSSFMFGQSIHFSTSDTPNTIEQVRKVIANNNLDGDPISIESINIIQPNIEDCFIKLMTNNNDK